MRKLNVKLLLVLVIGTATLAVAVGVAHAFQYGRIGDALLFQARRAKDLGQSDRVARYLARYLEFRPRDLDARAELARTLAGDAFAGSLRAALRAVRLLDEVLTSDPGRTDLRRLLAKVALEPEVGQLQTARKQLEVLLPENESAWPDGKAPPAADAARGELEVLWGRLCEAETRLPEAVRFYRQAVHDLPAEQLSYIRLANLLRRQKETDLTQAAANAAEADDLMRRLVENNPESHEAYLARWNYRREFKYFNDGEVVDAARLTDAAEDVAKAHKRSPESVEVLLAASDLAQLRADVVADEADDPKDPKASPGKTPPADEGLPRGGPRPPAAGPEGAGESGPVRRPRRTRRQTLVGPGQPVARRDRRPGRPTGSEGSAASLRRGPATDRTLCARERARRSASLPADVLQARLWMAGKEWAKAATLLELSRPALQSPPELAARVDLYLARCYQQMEEPWKQAMLAYQRVVSWDRESVAGRLGLAETKWALGSYDDAVADDRQVMARNKVPAGGWLDLARLEVERQMQRDVDQRDWSAAEDDLARAAAASPGVPEATVLKAEVLLARGKPDAAEALLQKACDANPKKPEYWVALATLAAHHGERFASLAVLREAEKAVGDNVQLRLAHARFWASQPDEKQRREALAALKKDADKLPTDDRPRLLAGLAEAQYLAGDPAARHGPCSRNSPLLPAVRGRPPAAVGAVRPGRQSWRRRSHAGGGSTPSGPPKEGRVLHELFGQALRDLWLARERKQRSEKLEDRLRAGSCNRSSRPGRSGRGCTWPAREPRNWPATPRPPSSICARLSSSARTARRRSTAW